jgi:predicted ABC-type transport system involved in lysophospholipase L1 biosynthesis ATPase subunit
MSQTTGPESSPLCAEGLTKRFRQGNTSIEAVRDLSLTVERGALVAVMGTSGSGKSTLLHLLAGLTRPDAGRVLIDGQDFSTMSDRQLSLFRRRHIGLVFQAFNLIPALTAEQNIHRDGQIAPIPLWVLLSARRLSVVFHDPGGRKGRFQESVQGAIGGRFRWTS